MARIQKLLLPHGSRVPERECRFQAEGCRVLRREGGEVVGGVLDYDGEGDEEGVEEGVAVEGEEGLVRGVVSRVVAMVAGLGLYARKEFI